MKKIQMKISNTIAETFEDFITSRRAKGLSDKTISTYNQHFRAVGRFLNLDNPIDELTNADLESLVIYLRHTKSKKSQVIPLCSELCGILKEYMRIRGGSDNDYLFPNENGEQLKEYGLRSSIARYNKRHGVEKTSIHAFRHTFARKYLVDCGGNAFTLQRLLGHSTLDMTKHYCAIFDADIAKNYDRFSPLAQMKANSEKIKIPKKRK